MRKTPEKRLLAQRQFNLDAALSARSVTNVRSSINSSNSSVKKGLVPATQAVLIQGMALIAVFLTSKSIYFANFTYFGTDISFSVAALVLMQAFFAAIFSNLAGMATWWRWIHLCFPMAIWLMFSWHVPSGFYLAGFIISLSLFWTTFRTQVPFFPSRPMVWQQVVKLMPQAKSQHLHVRMIDIGSGLGDMSMHVAKARPDSDVEGIEIAPLPWLISLVRAMIFRSSAKFKLGDYRTLDFSNYDVIFAYLSPAAMVALWGKARHEMQSGSILISLEFDIPGVVPSLRITGDRCSPVIYVWRLP